VPIERRRQTTAVYEQALDEGRRVRFRLPTGADQEAVLDLAVEQAAEALLDRCLVGQEAIVLTAAERAMIGAAMERLAPQLDLEFELACPECEHRFVLPFDLTTFFFAELRSNSRHLLREIHVLAFHYHWGEGEILGLTRTRRREYLALLSEATAQ